MKKLTDDKCREQFEEWLTSLPGFELADLQKHDNGKYIYKETEWCWKSWQASRDRLEIALPVLEQQEKGEAEWICWDGEMALPPVGNDVVVEARMRSGDSICAAAKTFRWRNYVQQSNDIVAYRVVKSGGATQPTKDTYQQIENDGWIEWKGGLVAPVTGRVDVRYRNGREEIGLKAKDFSWKKGLGGMTIIAYRVIENDGREG